MKKNKNANKKKKRVNMGNNKRQNYEIIQENKNRIKISLSSEKYLFYLHFR